MTAYVEPRRPRPFGPILTLAPPPPPEKEQDVTEAEAIFRASYAVPSHIIQGAQNVFRENLLERDKIEPDLMTGGAFRYFVQHYAPAMAAQQVRSGVPGTDEGWGHYSLQAVRQAMAVYNRDQTGETGGGGGTQPLRGPISVSGRDFEVPQS